MADESAAYMLVDAAGFVYGACVIESLNETHTSYDPDGVARGVDFTIALRRGDDELADAEAEEA